MRGALPIAIEGDPVNPEAGLIWFNSLNETLNFCGTEGVIKRVSVSENVSFTNQTSVTITHNLGRYPMVTVICPLGLEQIIDKKYDSLNAFTVSWNTPKNGTIIYC